MKIALDELTVNNVGQLKAIAKNLTVDPLKGVTRLAYLNDVCAGCVVAHVDHSQIILDCLQVLPAYTNCGLEQHLWDYLKTHQMKITGSAPASQTALFESFGCQITKSPQAINFEYNNY